MSRDRPTVGKRREVSEHVRHWVDLTNTPPEVPSDDELRDFDHWISNQANMEAFARVERFWNQLDRLPPALKETVAGAEDDDYDGSVPIKDWLRSGEREG